MPNPSMHCIESLVPFSRTAAKPGKEYFKKVVTAQNSK